MTGHEDDFLVTVRAQVMTRDESTEGWLPLAGGGLANVSIRKRARLSPGAAGHEYIIYGQRISDQSIILSCVINRDLKYYKVMPTFHHWRAGKQRNGLTFLTAADARAFDKGILRVYNELIDDLVKSNPSIFCPPLTKYDSVGEDDVFMTLDLPVETELIQKSHSSPEGSEKSQRSLSDCAERLKDALSNKSDNDKSLECVKQQQAQPTIHYISSDKSSNSPLAVVNKLQRTTALDLNVEPVPAIPPGENYSYVTLTSVHDYNYPVVDQPSVAAQVLTARRESISTLKKRNALEVAHALAAAQSSPLAASISFKDTGIDIAKKQRSRCRYCCELYQEEWNRKGACEAAPDNFRSCCECVSCMGCARGMLYHCMRDGEGDFPQHPCECVNETGCTKKWFGLTLLSFLVPCLCFYPPLRACHLLGVSCGICGGKHKPEV